MSEQIVDEMGQRVRKTKLEEQQRKERTPCGSETPVSSSNMPALLQRAESEPETLQPEEIDQLHQAIGNRGVGALGGDSPAPATPQQSLQRMLANRQIQAKLTLGAVNDPYEQEADQIAKHVVGSMNSAEQPAQRQGEEEEMMAKRAEGLQRQEEEEEMMAKRVDTLQRQEEEEEMMAKRVDTLQRQEEEEEMMAKHVDTLQRQEEEEEMMAKRVDAIQRAPVVGAEGGTLSAEMEQEIRSARGGGQALDASVRAPMESALNADFSNVKVHSDSQSDALNKSVQAKAFTTGQDIFFRSGEYNPGSSGGQELLAHELTHVVQQNGPAVERKEE